MARGVIWAIRGVNLVSRWVTQAALSLLEQEEQPLELEEGLLKPLNYPILQLDEKIKGTTRLLESSVGLSNQSVKLILPCEISGQS